MKTNKQLNEGIRVAKEGIEECWDDMGGQEMTTGENGEQMSVTISMPGKNISVTTNSAEEIGNILRLAGINVGGGAVAGDVDGDGDHDIHDHEAEVAYVGTGSESEPSVPSSDFEEDPAHPGAVEIHGSMDAEGAAELAKDLADREESEEEKDETKEATQTPKPWTDSEGNEHPGTAVKGDRYGNQEEKDEDKEVDESVEELDEETARILALAGITNEAQSAAQKAAFKAMIAKKNGDKVEEKDDNKKPDADGDGVPDWADKKPGKDDEVKEDAPAGNSIFGQSVYEAEEEAARILALAGVSEGKLMNAPADTSMPEPKTFDSLPSRIGGGAGHKDYGQNRANNQGENPMGMHTPDVDKSVDESFAAAMGEYRKFVAENISRKK